LEKLSVQKLEMVREGELAQWSSLGRGLGTLREQESGLGRGLGTPRV
jgi:hypothetical protein